LVQAEYQSFGLRTAHTRALVARVWLCAFCLVSATACSVYTGSATTLQPTELRKEPGWVSIEGVPELHQAHELDCGPTALAMVLSYYGVADQKSILAALPADKRSSVSDLRDLARQHGFESYVVEGKPEDLVYELQHGRPVIVGVAKPTVQDAVAHYEVLVGMHRDSQRVATLDPAVGMRQNSFSGFLSEWQGSGRVLLLVIPKRTSAGVSQRAPASAPGL
jgi:ABC-type bacteriocin/lantibiotic exporter with double-glycine peptidase domain